LAAVGNGGWRWAVGSEDLEGAGNVLSSGFWDSGGLSAWAFGDDQGSRFSDRVGLSALNNGGWNWAVCGEGLNNLGAGNIDGWAPALGDVARWLDVAVRV